MKVYFITNISVLWNSEIDIILKLSRNLAPYAYIWLLVVSQYEVWLSLLHCRQRGHFLATWLLPPVEWTLESEGICRCRPQLCIPGIHSQQSHHPETGWPCRLYWSFYWAGRDTRPAPHLLFPFLVKWGVGPSFSWDLLVSKLQYTGPVRRQPIFRKLVCLCQTLLKDYN